jgi:hypothetical protein
MNGLRKAALLALPLLALGLAAGVGATGEEPALLFVITGQSNAGQQGAAGQLTAAQRAPVDGAWYYAPQHTGQRKLVALQPYGGAFGVELSFARAVAEATGRKVVVTKTYLGGASIVAWDPDAPNAAWHQAMRTAGHAGKPAMYPRVAAVKRAAENAHNGPVELAGVLYLQVERDSKIRALSPEYGERLEELIAAWRNDWDAPHLPVVVMDSHTQLDAGGAVVHDEIVAVAARVPNVAWVAVRDLPTKDGIHFSTPGVLTLGQRMAAAWLEIQE